MTTGSGEGMADSTTADPDVELHPEPSGPAGGFPLRQMIAGLVALVVVAAGLVSVWIWNDRTDVTAAAAPANPGPQIGDHWHAYFGLAVCSPQYTTIPSSSPARGMFAAADGTDQGVIHIQPTAPDNAGANATINHLLDAFSVEISDDGQILAGGTAFYPDGTCPANTDGAPVGEGHLSWTVNGRAVSGNPGAYVPADGDVILVSFNPDGTTLTVPATAKAVLAAPAGHVDLPTAQAQLACVATPAPPAIASPVQFPQADQVIDPAKTYTATITTSCGDVTIALDAAKAPQTVNNFVFLARKGWYDGTPIHRIVPGFVIQAGDPTGQGTGGPGYSFADENLGANFATGTVAMANSGAGATNGSQFFIVTSDDGAQQLNATPNYSIFATVTGGADIVKLLDSFGEAGSQTGAPLEPLSVLKVTITES
jgi:cyclophilin family peptidyl-prolyl cis-trans isomerase